MIAILSLYRDWFSYTKGYGHEIRFQSFLVARHAWVVSKARRSVVIFQSSWALNEDELSIASYTTNGKEIQSAQT